MTTTAEPRDTAASSQFAHADTFLQCLAAQDFARLGTALTSDARFRALLPRGPMEWTGADVVADQFAHWFGNTDCFEVVGASVEEIGGRLHLRWRLRLQAERLGAGWFTVEQQAYADTADGGRITRLDLLCTGYRLESDDD